MTLPLQPVVPYTKQHCNENIPAVRESVQRLYCCRTIYLFFFEFHSILNNSINFAHHHNANNKSSQKNPKEISLKIFPLRSNEPNRIIYKKKYSWNETDLHIHHQFCGRLFENLSVPVCVYILNVKIFMKLKFQKIDLTILWK